MYRGRDFNDKMFRWEARIYMYKERAEDGLLGPALDFVGTFSTELAALMEAEKAAQSRDTVILGRRRPSPTHLRLLVVSDSFRRRSHTERLGQVFDALADSFFTLDAESQFSSPRVASMPDVRHLGDLHARLLIDCRTPTEWRPSANMPPEEELYGSSRLGHRTIANHPSTADASARRGVRNTVRESNRAKEGELASGRKEHWPHFFHGLSKESREMLIMRYKESRSLLHDVGEGMTKIDNARKNMLRAAAVLATGGLSELRDQDQAIFEAFEIQTQHIKSAAIRMQRIRRLHSFPRAIRCRLAHHRAAIAIQRALRGRYGRRLAVLWKIVRNAAVARVIAFWRGYRTRIWYASYKLNCFAGSVELQRLFRGYIVRVYYAWVYSSYSRARSIQSIVRGFLARCRYRLIREEYAMHNIIHPAILVLQSVARVFLARRRVHHHWQARLHVMIVVPAANVIQKVWRGRVGRAVRDTKLLERRSATVIQRHARGFLRRKWWAKVQWHLLEHRMATKIEAVARGYIDRDLCKARARQAHLFNVCIPAATLIQAQWRGYVPRRDLAHHRERWLAAFRLQLFWRGLLFKREAQRQWEQWRDMHRGSCAATIQRGWRCHSARKRVSLLNIEEGWRRAFASRVIVRAWRAYRLGLEFRRLLQDWEVHKAATKLEDARAEKDEVLKDIENTKNDIEMEQADVKMHKRRIQAIKSFLLEADHRLVAVEAAMDELTEEDLAGGWGENYEREWHMLSNCSVMAREEVRLLKIKIRDAEEAQRSLSIELDDLEADLDDTLTREFEILEALRRIELRRGIRQSARDKACAIISERMRWRIKSTRVHIIRRKRQDVDAALGRARGRRTLKEEMALRYDLRRDREKDEEYQARLELRQAAAERYTLARSKGEGNLPIRDAFDAAIFATKNILQASTFEMRSALGKKDFRETGHMCEGCRAPIFGRNDCGKCGGSAKHTAAG